MEDLPSQQQRLQSGVPDWLPSMPGDNNPGTEAVYLAWVSGGTIVGHLFARPGVDRVRSARRLIEQSDFAIARGAPDLEQPVNHVELLSGDDSGSGRGHGWGRLAEHEPTDELGNLLAYSRRALT